MNLFRKSTQAYEPPAEDVRTLTIVAAIFMGKLLQQTEEVACQNANALMLTARDTLIAEHAEQLAMQAIR